MWRRNTEVSANYGKGIKEVYFAILLSSVLDGFDQLIKLCYTVHCLSSALSICAATSEIFFSEEIFGAVIRTRGSWVMERECYQCAMLPAPRDKRSLQKR